MDGWMLYTCTRPNQAPMEGLLWVVVQPPRGSVRAHLSLAQAQAPSWCVSSTLMSMR